MAISPRADPIARSPEFLKNRAKALLRALRARAPDAAQRFVASHPQFCPTTNTIGRRRVSLRDAQLVVAREQGFASWPRLIESISVQGESTMSLGSPTPIIRIFDEAKAKEFYCDWLKFQVDWEHRFEAGFPLYLQISRDQCTIHLSEHHGDATPGAKLRIPVGHVDNFHRELMQAQYSYARPGINSREWGERDVTVADPFGNTLCFFGE